ncbi:MAG: DUF3343 domain-containing protein [Bacillota bacterium]|nr:DUF3343 domain-containing protein [Bacillota bacterium]
MNRKGTYFFFSGYCMVAAASEVLSRYHISNRIVKAPVSLSGSCNFALLVDQEEEDISCYMLERENLKPRKKYSTSCK